MVKLILDLIFTFRLKRAKLRANRQKAETGRKQFVLLYKGKPIVVSKQHLKQSIAAGCYEKGFTIQKAEKISIYQTL